MKPTSYRSAYTAKGSRPSQLKNLFNEHSPYCSIFFLRKILLHKNWRGGGELLLQNEQLIAMPSNHVIARARFTLSWAPGTLEYLNIFPPNYQKKVSSEIKKKSYLSAGPLALSRMLSPSLVIALRS